MALTAARRITGATAAFAALVIVASAADNGSLADADRAVFEALRARRDRARTTIARAVSALGEPAVIYPVLTIAAGCTARRVGWPRACMPCLVVAGGAAARRRLSRVIARQRPPADAWLTEPEGYSLPSKHTTLAALAAGACARTLGMRGVPAHVATLLAATSVGAGRVYLGVHWPADVVAGWLFAEGWLCLTGPEA
ncbi:MAG: phosphatase PAP2 family protein [Streptosporangiaceae bacterium]